MRSYDVIVVGAGPAGSSLALRLADAGLSVLLCERAAFPRPKLCGEFLSPEILEYLSELGAGAVADRLGGTLIEQVKLSAPHAPPLVRPWSRPGLGLSRSALDQALFDLARARGVECRQLCHVRAIRRLSADRRGSKGSGEVEIDSVLQGARGRDRARIVVDARGHLYSPVGRHRCGWVAFQRHFRPNLSAKTAAVRDLELYLLPSGYCGVSPVEGGEVNVCFLLEAGSLPRGVRDSEALLHTLALAHPLLHERLRSLEPLGGRFLAASGSDFTTAAPSSDLALSVGDAAGCIAPLCGDGISMAIRSAALAAEVVIHSFHSGQSWAEVAARYDRAWRAEFGRRQRLGSWLHTVALRPRASRALLHLCRVRPELADWLIRKTRRLDFSSEGV